ncbi:ribose 5-phosphate isomerase B [candidate division WOR-3 bacterium]|nr:ribose 5-phosphate isomerase B [candidate division WOR-3 bacterium]
MTVSIASDHRGFKMKESLKSHLSENGIKFTDEGPGAPEPVDYPRYADLVCRRITDGEADYGILICGSGLGMSIAANKHKGIRAALCMTREQVVSSRHHNDANVIVFAGDLTAENLVNTWIDIWLKEEFDGGRHLRRVQQLENNKTQGG